MKAETYLRIGIYIVLTIFFIYLPERFDIFNVAACLGAVAYVEVVITKLLKK